MISGFWEYLSLGKSFYRSCFDVVCKKYSLSRAELDILIFLYENPDCNTAKDITEKRGIAQSNVSTAIRNLTEQNYIEGYYEGENRRTIHLRMLDKCRPLVDDINKSRKIFDNAVFDGFDEKEMAIITSFFFRLTDNITKAKKEYANKTQTEEK